MTQTNDLKRHRVYCAGPLFNSKEKEEMQELADALEKAGFDTFLPQRDGLELTKCVDSLMSLGVDKEASSKILSRAIFALDVYQVMEACDAIVVNLNGRVPDEGAVSEAAIAWRSGKIIVGYKSDSRTVFMGGDNPLVSGLFDFTLHQSFCDVIEEIESKINSAMFVEPTNDHRNRQIGEYLLLGDMLWQALKKEKNLAEIASILYNEAKRTPQSGKERSCRKKEAMVTVANIQNLQQ